MGAQASNYFTLKFTPVLVISIVNGLIIMALYAWINAKVLTDPTLYNPSIKATKRKKLKLSLVESFKLIFSSKYLGLITILVLAYGTSTNLVEGIWKAKIHELYPTKEAYTAYMGEFQGYMGVTAIIFMLVGSNILRRVSWGVAASITPIMMLLTGLAFFAFIFFDNVVAPKLSLGKGPS